MWLHCISRVDLKEEVEIQRERKTTAYLMICPSSSGVAGFRPSTIWHTCGFHDKHRNVKNRQDGKMALNITQQVMKENYYFIIAYYCIFHIITGHHLWCYFCSFCKQPCGFRISDLKQQVEELVGKGTLHTPDLVVLQGQLAHLQRRHQWQE